MEKINFTNQNKIGKIGEAAVKDFLISKGYKVEDESNNRTVCHEGDLFTEFNGVKLKFEVKTDLKADQTGNLVIEYMTNLDKGSLGWFKLSTADYFAFYLYNTNEIIFLSYEDLHKAEQNCLVKRSTIGKMDGDQYVLAEIGLIKIDLFKDYNSFRRVQL